jgi:hypothetical protein
LFLEEVERVEPLALGEVEKRRILLGQQNNNWLKNE